MATILSTAQSGTKTSHRQIRLFVLIDALGWKYIQERQFLNDILPYRWPLTTVLGFSSGAIPTILTGAAPMQTGHWNLFYYDPAGSPYRWLKYFSFLPDTVLNHRVTTKLLKELGRHVLGMGPLFDCAVPARLLRWFNYVEKRNIYARGGIMQARSIFDRLAESAIPHRVYTYHDATDGKIVQQVKHDLATTDARFFFIYLSEMDMFLHTHCLDPKQVSERVTWYDKRIREIYTLARDLDAGATLTIFSDHGMTPVQQHHDLMSDIEALGLRMPQDYLVVYDSTMARFWFFSDEARRRITGALKATSCGRILPETELRQLGVWFEDLRYGEMVFLLNPGWLLSRSGFNGPRWVPAGMHGYHPDDPYSDAIFLSNRQPASQVRTVADVYKCLIQAAVELV